MQNLLENNTSMPGWWIEENTGDTDMELNLFSSNTGVSAKVLHESVRQSSNESNPNCINDVYNDKKFLTAGSWSSQLLFLGDLGSQGTEWGTPVGD